MSLIAAAILTPWRAWPAIWRRGESSWLYLLFALESLLMRPDSATRAIWAVGRRGVSSLFNVVRLAAIEIIIILIASYILAALFRLSKRRTLDMGQIAAALPWAFLPKLLVTSVFTTLWAFDLAPASAMIAMGFETSPAWAAAYHVLGYGAVAASVVLAFLSAPEDQREPALGPVAFAPFALLLVAVAAIGLRISRDPRRFRPIGRGDAITNLAFAPLTATEPLRFSFPRERPVVIDFWASWCGPCVEGMPDWDRLASDSSLDADLVSANVEIDTPDLPQKLLRDRGFQFATHIADAGTQSRFQVQTLPTTIVIGTDGNIREYWVGTVSASSVRAAVSAVSARDAR